MSSPAIAGLRDFFHKIWGEHEGYVYLPVKDNSTSPARVKKIFAHWPAEEEKVYRHVLKWAAVDGAEVYFSPALYSRMRARNEDVLGAQVAWADFDNNFPTNWPDSTAPLPSIEIQSSSVKNRHVYWLLDEFLGRKEIENLNRALAYALGADTSGWDANQFLRPPFSANRKYRKPISVKIIADREELAPYSVGDFEHIPVPRDAIAAKLDMDSLPSIEDVRALAKWDEDLVELFDTDAETAKGQGWDRSGALARVSYKGAELGWTDEQIMAGLLDADERWGKYAGRSNQVKLLEELINRARAKIGYDVDTDNVLFSKLLGVKPGKEPRTEVELPEFMTVSQINDIPGIDNWLIEGLLREDGVGLFTGRPGTGKTQLALQLAADAACGRDKFIEFAMPGKPMKVLVLSLEMSFYNIQLFTSMLPKIYDKKLLDKNITLWNPIDPVQLTEKEGQNLFNTVLDDIDPDIVIVDSLSESANNISDDSEMKELFSFLHRLRHYHRFGLVFIHHHRKKANDAASRKQPDSQSDIYGSYKISASVDFALNLEDRGHEEGLLELNLLKARYCKKFDEPWMLRRDENLHFTRQELDKLRESFNAQDFSSPQNGETHEDPSLAL